MAARVLKAIAALLAGGAAAKGMKDAGLLLQKKGRRNRLRKGRGRSLIGRSGTMHSSASMDGNGRMHSGQPKRTDIPKQVAVRTRSYHEFVRTYIKNGRSITVYRGSCLSSTFTGSASTDYVKTVFLSPYNVAGSTVNSELYQECQEYRKFRFSKLSFDSFAFDGNAIGKLAGTYAEDVGNIYADSSAGLTLLCQTGGEAAQMVEGLHYDVPLTRLGDDDWYYTLQNSARDVDLEQQGVFSWGIGNGAGVQYSKELWCQYECEFTDKGQLVIAMSAEGMVKTDPTEIKKALFAPRTEAKEDTSLREEIELCHAQITRLKEQISFFSDEEPPWVGRDIEGPPSVASRLRRPTNFASS